MCEKMTIRQVTCRGLVAKHDEMCANVSVTNHLRPHSAQQRRKEDHPTLHKIFLGVEAGLFFCALVGLLVLAVGAFNSGKSAQNVLGHLQTIARSVFAFTDKLETFVNDTARVRALCACAAPCS
jgi:hypothetical protein